MRAIKSVLVVAGGFKRHLAAEPPYCCLKGSGRVNIETIIDVSIYGNYTGTIMEIHYPAFPQEAVSRLSLQL